MPTHLAKSRKALKEKEAKEDAEINAKLDYKPVFEIEEKTVDDKRTTGGKGATDGNKGAADRVSGSDRSKMGDIKNAKRPRGRPPGKKRDVGGFVAPDNGKDKGDRDRRTGQEKKRKERVELLNMWASNMLSCLDPDAKENFMAAAFDAKVKDIGVYILGILNRMHKMADYFEPDIEPDWEVGIIGWDEDLYCQYCKKKIENPTHLKQIFCSNKCARNYKIQNTTGLIYPKTVSDVSTDPEEKQWDREQKRMGALT